MDCAQSQHEPSNMDYGFLKQLDNLSGALPDH